MGERWNSVEQFPLYIQLHLIPKWGLVPQQVPELSLRREKGRKHLTLQAESRKSQVESLASPCKDSKVGKCLSLQPYRADGGCQSEHAAFLKDGLRSDSVGAQSSFVPRWRKASPPPVKPVAVLRVVFPTYNVGKVFKIRTRWEGETESHHLAETDPMHAFHKQSKDAPSGLISCITRLAGHMPQSLKSPNQAGRQQTSFTVLGTLHLTAATTAEVRGG